MKINIPNKIKITENGISSVAVELYSPNFTLPEESNKLSKALRVIKLALLQTSAGKFVSPEIHDTVYSNFNSVRFVITYKDLTTEVLEFADKEELNNQPVLELPAVATLPEIVDEPKQLPSENIATEATAEAFFDEFAEEEERLAARLEFLRKPETIAKRKELSELMCRVNLLKSDLHSSTSR